MLQYTCNDLHIYHVEINNYCIGNYHVLCVVFKVIVRAVLVRLPLTQLCALCDIGCSEIKTTLPWLNSNNLLAPKTLSVTFGDPARIARTLLPLSTALTVGKAVTICKESTTLVHVAEGTEGSTRRPTREHCLLQLTATRYEEQESSTAATYRWNHV